MRTLLIVFFIFFNGVCWSQPGITGKNYFEGKIVYQVTIHQKLEGADTNLLRKMLGYTSSFYFKEGNFRQVYDNWRLEEETYIMPENRTYYKRDNNDTFYWRPMDRPEPKMVEMTQQKNNERVMNIACEKLELIYPHMTKRLWYNPDTLSMDPVWFEKYLASDKHITAAIMKSLFLKCELDYPEVLVTLTAIRIEPQIINEHLFMIPGYAILKKED